ncbi:protein ALP1-like [Bactrocera tryoni]|uniref:protein ALP1-like n=1 Tax=Bactrocera tryoni TaxID=59916 RepID=UPI001A963BBB|nr:protein ALP1-like [Bactrocera tryoni]
MQGVVDNNYLFTDVSVKLPGSTHDATVFKESGLFKNCSTSIPIYTKLVNNIETPLFLVWDPAYPLLPWLMKPFIGNLNAEEESFNCHSVEFRTNSGRKRIRQIERTLAMHCKTNRCRPCFRSTSCSGLCNSTQLC